MRKLTRPEIMAIMLMVAADKETQAGGIAACEQELYKRFGIKLEEFNVVQTCMNGAYAVLKESRVETEADNESAEVKSMLEFLLGVHIEGLQYQIEEDKAEGIEGNEEYVKGKIKMTEKLKRIIENI